MSKAHGRNSPAVRSDQLAVGGAPGGVGGRVAAGRVRSTVVPRALAHAARVAPLHVSSRRRITRVSSRARRIPRAAESQAATEATNIEDVEENEEELAERKAVSELVGWCVSKGAQGSGLSVLLPDDSGRGRGLEASRDIEVRSN